ncbi:MAG: signal recognition particle-docking protein FtsY [Synechococcaceae cyanobacterium]
MVFDWFKRTTVDPAEPAASPEPAPEPAQEPAPPAPPEASPAPEPPSTPETPSAAQTPAGSAVVDEDALVWARQAYARLKAQQEAARAAEPVASAPASAPTPEPAPPAAPAAPAAPEPPPAPAPGLSLLEQAAAQRQERLEQLTAAPPPEPVPSAPPAPLPTAAATPAERPTSDSEPSLGAFDDTFTWSADVLAAQGRRLEEVSLEEIDWLGRLRRGLEKTRRGLVSQLLDTLGDDPLTPEVLDDLESALLRADVGVQATDQVLEALRRRLNEEVVDPAEGLRFLKEQLRALLEQPITASGRELLVPERGRLNVWLMVGVNGVGKTTTLGKLANLAVRSGYSCMIAAADTFRAAAVEQVAVWGDRSGVPVVSNPSANADPAAVVFDAIGAARARGSELVLVDTAGRLQTKHNLMEELAKVRRIIDKLAPEAAVESLLVLDASQGQNGLRQALAFAGAAGLTGVVVTKLDGSARGGVALAVASEVGLPIRFIGAGEGIRDLRPFSSFEFVEALLAG